MMRAVLFHLEGDPAAGENQAVLFREQDVLLFITLAACGRLGY